MNKITTNLLTVFLTLALLLGISVPASAANNFSDVSENAWYSDAVEYMAEHELMSGTTAGVFSPNEYTSRAMLVTVLWRQAGKPAAEQTADFSDIAANTWYSDALNWTTEKHIINGYPDGTFHPNALITREEVAAILWRIADEPEAAAVNPFSDQNRISPYALQAVNWAKSAGIISGKEGNAFDPTGTATRAETAAILYRSATQNNSSETNQSPSAESTSGTPAAGGNSSNNNSSVGGNHGGNSSGSGSAATPDPAPNPDPTDPGLNSNSKVLVVYFSRTNNTKSVAEKIAETANSDIFEITAQIPYTDADINYTDNTCRANREQNDPNARPAITGAVSNISDYDIIFLGYPIWHGQAPKIIYTFLESCEGWNNQTIIPFCTSASSPLGSSATNLHNLLPNTVNWEAGRRFSSNASQNDVNTWINGLDLKLSQTESDTDKITLAFNNHTYTATLANNSSAAALKELLKNGSLTIEAHDFGNFEKVGEIGQTLPANDENIVTEAGDLILYQGTRFVVYYDTNTYNFTRLGKIDNPNGLKEALGSGNVTITVTLGTN